MPSTLILIASYTLSTTTQGLVFNSIPSTYRHLLVKGSIHSNRSAGNDGGLGIRFNDSATGYDYQQLYVAGTAVAGDGGSAFTQTSFGTVGVAQDTQNSNLFSPFEFTVANYANTGFYKAVYGSSANVPASAGNGASGAFAGMWQNTSAINKIEMRTNNFGSSSFVANSTYYLYGIE
jgi:hypothetical protein